MGDIRETEHERSAVLLGDEAPELPLGLVDGLLVVLADGWVALPHGKGSATIKISDQNQIQRLRSEFKTIGIESTVESRSRNGCFHPRESESVFGTYLESRGWLEMRGQNPSDRWTGTSRAQVLAQWGRYRGCEGKRRF